LLITSARRPIPSSCILVSCSRWEVEEWGVVHCLLKTWCNEIYYFDLSLFFLGKESIICINSLRRHGEVACIKQSKCKQIQSF
jgi:hypothetical protein